MNIQHWKPCSNLAKKMPSLARTQPQKITSLSQICVKHHAVLLILFLLLRLQYLGGESLRSSSVWQCIVHQCFLLAKEIICPWSLLQCHAKEMQVLWHPVGPNPRTPGFNGHERCPPACPLNWICGIVHYGSHQTVSHATADILWWH
jgi:hypothetical protein